MAPIHFPPLADRQAVPQNPPPPGVQPVPLQPAVSPAYAYDNAPSISAPPTIPTSASAVYLTGPPPPGVTVVPVPVATVGVPVSAGVPVVYETVTAPATRNAYGYGPPPTYMTTAGVFGQADPASQRQPNATGSDNSTAIAVGVIFAFIVLIVSQSRRGSSLRPSVRLTRSSSFPAVPSGVAISLLAISKKWRDRHALGSLFRQVDV